MLVALGPVYMVSGSRDNPSPDLTRARYFFTDLFKNYINRLHEVGETTRDRWRDNSGRRVVSPQQVG